MKQYRPSFRRYRAHIYRELFGNSLSVKPLIDKNGQRYAVLKTTPYKLFWMFSFAAVYILALIPGWPLGLLPFLALPALYILFAPFRYFFARFVELDADYITVDMYKTASRTPRPSFSAYLKYVYVPRRERLMILIEEDGDRFYRIPRMVYPESMLTTVLGFAIARVTVIMGAGMGIFLLLVFAGIYLLLAPLSLYFWRFKSTEEPEYYIVGEPESSTVLHKVVSGILIAASVAVVVLTFVFLRGGIHKGESINIDKPLTIAQAYNNAQTYSSEQFSKAEIIDYYIEFNGADALLSSEPAYVYFIFQDPPGFMPEPNVTLSFYSYQGDSDMRVYYREKQIIQPALNAALVTDLPEIFAILESELGVTPTSDISLIKISPADRSVFLVYNVNECVVEIRRGEEETRRYIVNIADQTARPA